MIFKLGTPTTKSSPFKNANYLVMHEPFIRFSLVDVEFRQFRMADVIREYLLFTEFLNVVEEAIGCYDEEFDDIISIDDFEDELNEVGAVGGKEIDEQLKEFTDFEEIDAPLDDCKSEIDILQCMINIIELKHVLSKYFGKKKSKRQRRWGVHPINQLRREQGHFNNLFEEMIAYDHEKFFNYTRMTPERFDHLLSLVGPSITKNAPNALPPKCRLLITLRFLASGDSLKSLHYNFRVGVTTAYNIVRETCEALWTVLQPVYLKFPSEEDWLKIAEDFNKKLHFPNCCGAVDGKLIEVYCPNRSGSMFYNYQKYFSTNLMAICDANKSFTYVDIGSYGKQSDGGVLFHSTFGQRLDTNNLNLPPPTSLPDTNTEFPFFFIGDAAYPLKENLLTPYAGDHLSDVQANFNNELSSSRKNIENAFAILVRRWLVFSGPINMQPNNVESILKAAIVLHNYIKSSEDEASIKYMREERYKYPTTQGLVGFYESGLRLPSASTNERAHVLRDMYANYLKIT